MHEPVEVLVVDLFFIGAAVVAISWVKRRWVRVVSIVAALAAGTAFVLLRDRYDLEDSAFLWTLFLFCIVAAAITTATCIGLRRDVRTSAAYGAVDGCWCAPCVRRLPRSPLQPLPHHALRSVVTVSSDIPERWPRQLVGLLCQDRSATGGPSTCSRATSHGAPTARASSRTPPRPPRRPPRARSWRWGMSARR